MDSISKYYSENPEKDIWLKLQHYSYLENIEKYLNKNNLEASSELSEVISGSILQAYEYFEASKVATIQTAPLLLYYGATNLLFGAACLKSGEIIDAKGHGMKVSNQDSLKKNVLENTIKLVNPSTGGFYLYLKHITEQKFVSDREWSIKELLGSIPEISKEFISNFGIDQSHIIPLEKVISDDEVTFRVNHDILSKELLDKKLEKVVGYKLNYHPYDTTYNNEAIFRTKLNGDDLSNRSFHNEFYFSVGHESGNQVINFPSSFFEYMTLYGLATICRYHPSIWTPFVRNDNSGMINFIEKFLLSTRRYLPNYILNEIENKQNYYSNELYIPKDTKTNISERKLEEIIKSTILEMGDRRNGLF